MAAWAALACDSNTGPRLPFIPPLGTYTYTFTHPADANGIIAARAFSGTLVLTYAAADSIAGRWEVPGYAPQPFGGSHRNALQICEVDACPTPQQEPFGVALVDSLDLPYQLGAAIVDGTAADSSALALHFLFWHPDKVVCAAFRFGVVGQQLVTILGTCTLGLPTILGPPVAP